MTIYILGAGPTALAAVDGFSENTKENIVLIEGSNCVGGLAQTLNGKIMANMIWALTNFSLKIKFCGTVLKSY